MVERKLYKTKLCVLYQRGRCRRQNCSFAHGDAELRRFPSFSTGRRDYWGGDLRDKINKRRSPIRRYSPGRDGRSQHFHGHSPPRSLGKRSDRKHRKRKQFDGQSDNSGGMKNSDGAEDTVKNKKLALSDSRGVLDDQLRQVQSELEILGDHKRKLEIYLEEMDQEADILSSGIQEFEMKLGKEKEEYQRLNSKIKKFIKTHNRHLQLQDELKRSQTRLQKLADQLGADASRHGTGANEENSNMKIVSDGEMMGNNGKGQAHEFQTTANTSSPSRKRSRVHLEMDDNLHIDALREDGFRMGQFRSGEHERLVARHISSTIDGEVETEGGGKDEVRSAVNLDISKMGKLKGNESGLPLPLASIAAHAVDDFVDVVEMGEKLEVVGNANVIPREGTTKMVGFPFQLPPPPPPPVLQNAYSLYQGEDENVDVEGNDEEMVHVDIV